jgi:hypothetical protein
MFVVAVSFDKQPTVSLQAAMTTATVAITTTPTMSLGKAR